MIALRLLQRTIIGTYHYFLAKFGQSWTKELKTICTIGPSCKDVATLKKLKEAGVDIFRINLSHANLDEIEKYYSIANDIGIRIGIDTEGAQIRTKLKGEESISLIPGSKFRIDLIDSKEADCGFSLYPKTVYSLLEEGDIIRLDFNGASIQVTQKEKKEIILECITGGVIGDNKAADCSRCINLPDFTEKDLKGLRLANQIGIEEIFVSFCKSDQAIKITRDLVKNANITSKIESKLSINSLISICKNSDAILIDRGDLTREINILDIPFAQRGIIEVARREATPCYVATNVLESLINGDLPNRAELNDIISTIEMGASGIVLAAETAIGKHPILCAEIIKELIHRFQLHKAGLLFADIERNEITDEKMRMWLNRGR